MGKRLLTIAALAVAVIWIVNNPHGAAADVHKFFAAVTAFATAI